MMKKAASLWNIPVSEVADSIDPLVSLLLSACASEFEKISGDVNDAQNRITERLIQLMTPQSACEVKPAHAMAYCEPVEPKTTITAEHQFYCKLKPSKQDIDGDSKTAFFTPTKKTNLIGARIKHMLAGNKLFSFSEGKSKDLTKIIANPVDSEATHLFLGIETNHSQLNLQDVSFYFEHLGLSNSELFYHHLQQASWYIGDKKINTVHGFSQQKSIDNKTLEQIIEGEFSVSDSLCADINNYYKKHFVTVKLEDSVSDFPKYSEFENLNIEDQELFLGSNILWIKVQFSSVISSKTLEQLYCAVNAFPILNRKQHQFTYQLKNFIDIIPVLSEAPFFDIQSIENSNGQPYKPDNINAASSAEGRYFLKNANVAKLDSRKAWRYIVHLLELLKDESAAFNFFNREFLQHNLNSLNQTMASIEKKLGEVYNHGIYSNYVYLNPYANNENVKVRYWTTDGEIVNHINSGQNLEVYKGGQLKSKSCYLLRPVFGGTNSLSMEQRLQAYRRQSLSKNRIVTEEDVKALCYELYTNNIQTIEIKKGFATDLSVNKGLIQCIEIILTPSDDSELKPYEWDYLNDNLLAVLEKQSVNIFPYKIIKRAS
ncbi:hypothetical protein F6U93_12875 [Tamlana haliotis]|uniref:Type VI secretion system baseplate subunit TssF n=1 Tax=Pseudotamlana haliotis TaxID=2614804 RepID=A0A6N6M9W1_9FLAO|nr:type VI secretion system baseplate subunit TssF [Tamlana haliotis]KAB1067299.1 hypothetical protein F6U93_12875 [Tamlana haliotis]